MKKRVMKPLAAVVGLALLTACATASVPTTASAQAGKPQRIGLKSLKFTPRKVTIKPGTPVIFAWDEKVAHNIVFSNKGPKSPTLNKGVWTPDSKAFAKPGTYKYKCTLHPGMDGEITIQ
jgi:plastocyanin